MASRPDYPQTQASKHRGVALITVLMVVAIAVSVSTLMLVRQQRAISRTASLLEGEQSLQYNLAAEDFSMEILAEDARSDANSGHGAVDSNFEMWATQWPPFPIDGGVVRARITDEQGLFNLNNLINSNGQPDTEEVSLLQNILNANQIPPGLVQAILDWIDPDNDPSGPMGAESDWYMRLEHPYRAANTGMAAVSELRLIRGMTEAYYQKLKPLMTVLPQGTLININTIRPQLLAAMIPGLSVAQAQTLIAAGAPNGYERTDSFMTQPAIAALPQQQLDALSAVLTVNSSYFRVSSEVDKDQHLTVLRSIIRRRSATDLQVCYREQVLPQLSQAAAETGTDNASMLSSIATMYNSMNSMKENALNAHVFSSGNSQP